MKRMPLFERQAAHKKIRGEVVFPLPLNICAVSVRNNGPQILFERCSEHTTSCSFRLIMRPIHTDKNEEGFTHTHTSDTDFEIT